MGMMYTSEMSSAIKRAHTFISVGHTCMHTHANVKVTAARIVSSSMSNEASMAHWRDAYQICIHTCGGKETIQFYVDTVRTNSTYHLCGTFGDDHSEWSRASRVYIVCRKAYLLCIAPSAARVCQVARQESVKGALESACGNTGVRV